jgi:hypothetical protein
MDFKINFLGVKEGKELQKQAQTVSDFEFAVMEVDRRKGLVQYFLYYPFQQDIELRHHLLLAVIKLMGKVEVQIDVICIVLLQNI